uniref:Haemolysin XhlA n=1 Tax=Candidatus Kentrum eta TaxID=2126337 RepID=A0A450VHG4_9GAMM|nr:MAG: hypothetical protein BECKH772A_GA0070896_101693 [Candidatus Kentron sp. H]VFJ99813.1 MAG: hypothetical protein BECKH772B_GA0070898_101693 [Candidatus Kentron sp. H]VFK04198.1 MAG: hypothetical protein BECKH772C_GA0070978_101663 [Candidatus Kentron sp. H]
MKARTDQLESEMKIGFERSDAKMERLASEMKTMEQRLIIRLGGMLAFSVIVVGALVKFL